MVKEAITPPISAKRKIKKVSKKDKSQESNKAVDTPKRNKTEKVISLDKSRSTQRTEKKHSK